MSKSMRLWKFELEGLSGMHYATFADTVEQALGNAKNYAKTLHEDPSEEDRELREVVSVYLEDTLDIV